MNRSLLIAGLLLWISSLRGQVAVADSLEFVGQAQQLTTLPQLDSLADWQIGALTGEWGRRAARWAEFFKHQQDSVTRERVAAEEALTLAKADTLTAKETVKTLQAGLKKWQNAEKQQGRYEKQTQSAVTLAERIPQLPVAKQRKELPKLDKKVQELANLAAPPPPPAPPVAAPADTVAQVAPTVADTAKSGGRPRIPKVKKEKAPAAPAAPPVARYDPAKDVLLNPPVPPCSLAVERKDEFTGAVYRECQRTELLRYTNPVMKKVLPEGQSHIVCQAALASDGSNGGTLSLTFQIRDANARRTFGTLPKGGIFTLKFIDGELITLYNNRAEEGQFDPETGLAVYRATYPFEKALFKKLEKTELDQIRIQWSTGYEDYGVQQVDLLQRQAGCLK